MSSISGVERLCAGFDLAVILPFKIPGMSSPTCICIFNLIRLPPFKVKIIDGTPLPALHIQPGRRATADSDGGKDHQGRNYPDLHFLQESPPSQFQHKSTR